MAQRRASLWERCIPAVIPSATCTGRGGGARPRPPAPIRFEIRPPPDTQRRALRLLYFAEARTMWPNIFGPGWGWGTLVALAFLCLVLGVLGFLLLVFKEPPRSVGESSDQLWHRWEEGDITRYEFERLRRAGQTHLGPRGAGN